MPVYPYRCEAGHEVDLLHAAGSDPGPCPECGGRLARVWAAPAVHLPGRMTQRQRKLLDRAAEQGANDHDDKMRAQRAERAKAKAQPPPPQP